MIAPTVRCRVLRCSRQDEMYIYLRDDLDIGDIPPALRQRAGRLEEVMTLELGPRRKLARVDVSVVIQRLAVDGVFLQLPPNGQVRAPLHCGG